MNNNHGIPTNGWDSIIDFLWAEERSDLFGEFISMTNRLDIIRNQNILKINPEYTEYFKM